MDESRLARAVTVPRKPRAKCDSAPQSVDIQSEGGIPLAIQIS